MSSEPAGRAPTATYRLQLRREFGFDEAAAVVPYLADLGVSHVYCSPYLQAAPGSTHGYDVIDHGRVNDELGGEAAHARFVAACRAGGLGVVLDVVPNHMAVSEPESQNSAWWDVLAHGRVSAYASWFDIDWDDPANPGKVLLPVLGDALAACLERGEISYGDESAGPVLRYFDHVLPVAPGTEHLRDNLPALLAAQHYRLCHWRVARDELNYRRFFDITPLAGLRVEDADVFEATHALVLEQVRRGELDGLRIDHPDGLADPAGYLDRLAAASGGAWVVVEKILEAGETLPTDWACAGTTGYDALNHVLGVLVDPAGEAPLTNLYTSLTGAPGEACAVVDAAKRQVLAEVLPAEVTRLTRVLVQASHAQLRWRDLTAPRLRRALEEVLAGFDVYRAYVPSADATARIDAAIARARAAEPGLADELWAIRELALAEGEFAVRFAQTTGPVMAKGVEDTAFYRYHRLVALNEVGAEPGAFGVSPDAFHAFCARLQRDWPLTMTTLSTHDTKRSEDVRARLAVLAELPGEWAAAVTEWRAAAAHLHSPEGWPDANAEYLFWQTLVGAWPLPADRALAYLEKATREAKVHTAWVDGDPAYDAGLRGFVERVLGTAPLLAQVDDFVTRLDAAWRSNLLAQKVVQLTMPGVPDVYQGTELVDLSLVDPDNRRPVDYAERMLRLGRLDDPKLRITATALRLRREHPEWFGARATYEPLHADGPAARHALAFDRSGSVITVATRLPVGLARQGGWQDTRLPLPPGDWEDLLTGRVHQVSAGAVAGTGLRLAELLAEYPVALLSSAGRAGHAGR